MDKKEILRYLSAGAAGNALDEMLERAEKEVLGAAAPHHVWREFPIEVCDSCVRIGGENLMSRDLAHHLMGCKSAALFAMTLGPGIDALIRRYSLTEMPFVPVLQACGAAYTEECADRAQLEIERAAAERNLYLRPRYSPGYGDLSLETQTFFFSALEISKRIGVTLNASYLMIPFKSITAIIGLSPDPSLCHVGKCMTCDQKNCPFRKEA